MLEQAGPAARLLRALLVMAVFVAAAGTAHAYTLTDLYEAAVPGTDRTDAGRNTAFREALGIVLVKVTGRADAPQRMRDTVAGARRYVQRYGLDAQGRLEVGFDPTAIDGAVTAAGLPIWGRQRPATLMLARVAGTDGSVRWLTAEDTSAEREQISEAARLRGVPLVWPVAGLDDQRQLARVAGGGADPADFADLATRYRADAVLLADLESGATDSLAGSWLLSFGATTASIVGDPSQGIGLAAGNFANVYAAAATDVTTVDLDVSGIDDLAAYAAALGYLEGLTVVERVAVQEVAGDSIRLQLALRGDPSTLTRAIALDHRLTPVDVATVPGRLSYRLQP
jgi:uncharacterized protein